MKKIRSILLGMDALLLLVAAGSLAETMICTFTGERESAQIAVMETGTAKKVALTFDDGPNPEYTEPLLAGLKERGVSATFFLLGKAVEMYPDIAADIAADGHLIGTHAYEHVDLSRLSEADAVSQITKANDAIRQATGISPQYIRPPYGCSQCGLDRKMTMIEVLWDVDPRDWDTHSADQVAAMVTQHVRENDIILMHDASESSVQAAMQIIDVLQKQGYVFVTVDDILFE